MCELSDNANNFEFLGRNFPKNGLWDQNLKNLSLDPESTSLRYYVHQFSDKASNFDFVGPNLPQNGFLGSNLKSKSRLGISISEILCEPIFRQSGWFWIFGPKFAQKCILGSEFQKSMSRFKVSILEILCASVFRQNGQLWFF